MASLAFGDAPTSIGINAEQSQVGRTGDPQVSATASAVHLMGRLFRQFAKINRDNIRVAAHMRKCCAAAAVQENSHGFLHYSNADAYANNLIPLSSVVAQ